MGKSPFNVQNVHEGHFVVSLRITTEGFSGPWQGLWVFLKASLQGILAPAWKRPHAYKTASKTHILTVDTVMN